MRAFTLSLAAVLAAAVAATPLSADPVTGPFDSPAGLVRMVSTGDGFSQALQVGDATLFADGQYRFVTPIDRRGALVLVELASGGNACAAEYAWVHLDPKGPRATELFGTCSDLPVVSSDAETVTVRLPSSDPAEGFIDFVYDGRAIREVVSGQQALGAGPEQGGLPWVGRFPFELFRASDWRPLFLGLLGPADYEVAGYAFGLATPMEREGDWVVGEGCQEGACQIAYGAVALHVSDGRVLVALNSGEGPRLYGVADGPLPTALSRVMGQ